MSTKDYDDGSMSGSVAGDATTVMNGPMGRLCDMKSKNVTLSGNRRKAVAACRPGMGSEIFRWQSVSDYNKLKISSNIATASIPLSYTGTSTKVSLPVYLFNLTTPACSTWTKRYQESAGPPAVFSAPDYEAYVKPAYRLTRTAANVANPDDSQFKNYQWETLSSVTQGPLATSNQSTYIVEHYDMYNKNKSKGVHEWTAVDFAFYGSTTLPCKVHLYQVSFSDQSACAPVRSFKGIRLVPPASFDTVEADYDVLPGSIDEVSSADTFWTRFLARRLTGPLKILARESDGMRHITVHDHQVVCLPNNNNTDQNTQPTTCVKRMFFKGGRMKNFEDVQNLETVYNPAGSTPLNVTPNVINVGGETSGTQKHGYIATQQFADSVPCVREVSQERFLMVVLEMYDNYVTSTAFDASTTPSFDVVMRQKYSWPIVGTKFTPNYAFLNP